MWGGFPKVIEQVFLNAQLVIDRFHESSNKDLNKLRRGVGISQIEAVNIIIDEAAHETRSSVSMMGTETVKHLEIC
jgi:hypothetical protein